MYKTDISNSVFIYCRSTAGMYMRTQGNGSVPLGLPTRSNDQWFLSNIANANCKSVSPAEAPPPLAPPLLPVPPPPQKPLKATRHSAKNGKMHVSAT